MVLALQVHSVRYGSRPGRMMPLLLIVTTGRYVQEVVDHMQQYSFSNYAPKGLILIDRDADRRKAELEAQNSHGDGMMFKLDFDPRVIGNEILPDGTRRTGIGDFIRRTGLWQINARKDHMPFADVVKLDTEYIAHWSKHRDLWIIFRTVVNAVRHI